MRRMVLAAAAVALLAPAAVSAQVSFGVAARGGSLGLGGEGAIGYGRYVTVRGGIGVLPLSYTGEAEGIRYRIEATSPLTNLTVDFYPGLADFRISGGMMFFPEPTTFDARYSGTININGREYTDEEVGDLTGELDHGGSAPFLMLGLGRQTNKGIGIYLDLGAAFLKEQRFSYAVTGGLASDPQFRDDLEAERREIQEQVDKYLKVYPVLSAGIKYGF